MKKEFFGQSVDEAVEKAASALGAAADSLEYIVLDQEFDSSSSPMKKVILVDAEQVLEPVLSTSGTMTPEEEQAREKGDVDWAVSFCNGVFSRMGIDAQTGATEKGEQIILEVKMTEGGPNLRSGSSRELRGAIQHLINRAAGRGGEREHRFILDIGGTLKSRTNTMEQLAAFLADKISAIQNAVHIHLMDSQDRRLLHVGLVESERTKTLGRGDKQFRILSIEPSKK